MLKKEDIDAILAELAEVKQENAKLNEKVCQLEHRLEAIDRRSRFSNVVVNGLNCNDTETAKSEFQKLCKDVLKVNLNVTKPKIIGRNAVLFCLESSGAVQNLLSNKYKLKGQNVFIQKDFTPQEQKVRYNLRQLSKKIKSKDKTIKVRLGDLCIFVNDKKFTWSNQNIVAFSKQDLETLNKLFKKFKFNDNIIISDKPYNNDSQ